MTVFAELVKLFSFTVTVVLVDWYVEQKVPAALDVAVYIICVRDWSEDIGKLKLFVVDTELAGTLKSENELDNQLIIIPLSITLN